MIIQPLAGKLVTKINRKIQELITYAESVYQSLLTHAQQIDGIMKAEMVAAAGNAVGNAADLSATYIFHRVSGADAAKGVKLPAGVVGKIHIVINPVNAALLIYPQATEKIDSGTAGVALTGTALYTYMFIYESAAVGWNSTKFLVAD